MAGEAFWNIGGDSDDGTTTDGNNVTVDDTTGFVVTDASKWGLTSTGRAYYDPDGAAIGEDATFVAATRPYLQT